MKVSEKSAKDKDDVPAQKSSDKEKHPVKDLEVKIPKNIPEEEHTGSAKAAHASQTSHKGGKHDEAQSDDKHDVPAATSAPNSAKKAGSNILAKYKNLYR